MNTNRKRLRKLESSAGASDQAFRRIEFYDISPDGEEIPWPDRPPVNSSAKKVIRVCFSFRNASPEVWNARLAQFAQKGASQESQRIEQPDQGNGPDSDTTPIDPHAPLR